MAPLAYGPERGLPGFAQHLTLLKTAGPAAARPREPRGRGAWGGRRGRSRVPPSPRARAGAGLHVGHRAHLYIFCTFCLPRSVTLSSVVKRTFSNTSI
eukprot:scaffold75500_cov36-Phaeocystis_antarctica.AAC.2